MKRYIILIFTGWFFFLPNVAYAVTGDLSNWLYNLATHVPSLVKLVVAVAYVSGFGFLMGSIMKFKACAQGSTMMSSQQSLSGPLIHLLVGVALIYFGGFIQIGSTTFFGQNSSMAYEANLDSGALFSGMIAPIILILRLIGYIAFIKGFYILARLGGHQAQPGTLGKAVVHIIGGILAINVEATYVILLNTFQGPGI
jgi:intracellular multiplication protein IcmC